MVLKTIKERLIAAILVLMMTMTAVPAGDVTAEAASKNKVMEVNVDYLENAARGDDSSVYLKGLLSKKQVTFGKSYSIDMKIYVPETYFKTGRLWIKPGVYLWEGKDYETLAGSVTVKDGYSVDKNSKDVKKYKDFYLINAKIPMDVCYDSDGNEISMPTGKGQIFAGVFIAGFDQAYKGSIYIDDVSVVVNNKAVASQKYEDGKTGDCTYSVNSSDKKKKPKAVSFTGHALQVTKSSISLKKGKTATIKATATPSAKITYKSSNKKIVTVNAKGVVKGKKKGKATIYVKANGKTVQVKVQVK